MHSVDVMGVFEVLQASLTAWPLHHPSHSFRLSLCSRYLYYNYLRASGRMVQVEAACSYRTERSLYFLASMDALEGLLFPYQSKIELKAA